MLKFDMFFPTVEQFVFFVMNFVILLCVKSRV